MLGDRYGQAVGIDLLKGIGADHRLGNLAGNRHDRDRIKLGIGDGRQQIGCAGAGRGHAHRHLAVGPRHALRHEAAALLVACQYVMNQARLRQGVVDRQDRSAGDTGQRSHALPFEQAHNDLGAGEGFGDGAGHEHLLLRTTLRRFGWTEVQKEKPPSGLHRRGFWNFLSFFTLRLIFFRPSAVHGVVPVLRVLQAAHRPK